VNAARIDLAPAGTDAFILSEGPVWHAESGTLVWIDVEAGAVLRGTLDDATMRRLNYEVDGKKRDVAEVVREHLKR
jgi:sugar lactone lactonase YvrE